METKILNDSAICTKCHEEFYPDISYHNDATKCDSCIEYEIDRFYERGNPWEDIEDYHNDNDIPVSICEHCNDVYVSTDKGTSLEYCANCNKEFKNAEMCVR